MPFVEQHTGIRPDSCEVCRFLQLHPEYDRLREHTLSMLTGWMLAEDLQNADGPLPMRAIYVEEYAGASPGLSAPLEPRHWMLGLLAATEINLIIDPREGGSDDQ
ncbi:MAG: hypothetical protein GEU80_16390 [Dehalococcoidia bacterium]|nr:hypothetical protein [Dehalococcoidia bacterium]